MIVFDSVSYWYPDTQHPVLRDLSLEIDEGELLLVIGPSGAGKSTFLRCLNGLVPHFYGGRFAGRVRVAGRDPIALGPHGMSDLVGFVFQDPEAQFVVDTVEDELAFALENLAVPQKLMRKRVEEALDQLSIAQLRGRRINTLSGGEKQRVAIASVLTLQPRVLVLDEPTSQLDPQAAEEVLIAVRHLNEDLGLTIVLSEHRLERVVQYADRVLYFPGEGEPPILGDPATVLARVDLTPPLVTLGKTLGWTPLPLTIKAGRRFARRLGQLGDWHPEDHPTGRQDDAPVVQVRNLWHSYDGTLALAGISLDVYPGEFVAVMGRNGSGKTTLLKHLVGLLKPDQGRVIVNGLDTRKVGTDTIAKSVGYVPQRPDALLFADTVAQELAFTRRSQGMPPDPEADRRLLAQLGLDALANRYPRDLSAGERQRVALAAILVANPRVLLLDEPTRGLDYLQKEQLIGILNALRAAGKAIIMATHDVELVARCADRVVLMAEGQIVVDGRAREVMSESLVFASQVNKLFRDPRLVTVEDVLQALKRKQSSERVIWREGA
ncbi:MAG: ABC transporter ATP-binding protein [Anaerolineae bacterium]|nr:ABC transporter ATP-binding protein [Anaerolineae bacterium]